MLDNPPFLMHYKSEQAIKDAGKIRQEGKNYIVQDGGHHFFQVQCIINLEFYHQKASYLLGLNTFLPYQ